MAVSPHLDIVNRCAADPLVAALAQLIQDRWAAERAGREAQFAFPRHLLNMAVVITNRSQTVEAAA